MIQNEWTEQIAAHEAEEKDKEIISRDVELVDHIAELREANEKIAALTAENQRLREVLDDALLCITSSVKSNLPSHHGLGPDTDYYQAFVAVERTEEWQAALKQTEPGGGE